MAFLIYAALLLGEALFRPGHALRLIWELHLVIWTGLGTLIPIAAGCIYKIRLLAEGGPAVAE